MRESIKNRIDAVRRGEVPEGYRTERAMLFPNEWGDPVPLNTVLGSLYTLRDTASRHICSRNKWRTMQTA